MLSSAGMTHPPRSLRARLARPGHLLLIYGGALFAGLIAHWLRFPLPWMIGAMLFAAALRLAERPVDVPPRTRQIGQVLVASSVGLSFTPEAVRERCGSLHPGGG